jgi:parallel beta-helix repeat protein
MDESHLPGCDLCVLNDRLTGIQTELRLSSLTITNEIVTFEGIHFHCRIQVAGSGTLIANYCIFEQIDTQCEFTVEVWGGSKGIFTGCRFSNNTGVIVFRDRSEGVLTNCRFSDSENTAVMVLDWSAVTLRNCTFEMVKKFSVYLYRHSKGLIRRCSFLGQLGKGIFMFLHGLCWRWDYFGRRFSDWSHPVEV